MEATSLEFAARNICDTAKGVAVAVELIADDLGEQERDHATALRILAHDLLREASAAERFVDGE